eukprot:scaffold42789_cov22-Phaeocystis_antarctica.AAC.1
MVRNSGLTLTLTPTPSLTPTLTPTLTLTLPLTRCGTAAHARARSASIGTASCASRGRSP